MSSRSKDSSLIHVTLEGDDPIAVFEPLGQLRLRRPDTPPIETARNAEQKASLQWGWLEPLTWLSQGYSLGQAGVAKKDKAILISGPSIEVSLALVCAVAAGWTVIADEFTPLRWENDNLTAHPRQAPLLFRESDAQEAGLAYEPVRADCDSVTVCLPRATKPCLVVAALILRSAKAGESREPALLQGQAKLPVARSLAFDWSSDKLNPTEQLQRDLNWAQLPIYSLAFDRHNQDEFRVAWAALWGAIDE